MRVLTGRRTGWLAFFVHAARAANLNHGPRKGIMQPSGLFMMGSQEPVSGKQIVAFDLDHTIVAPCNGGTHPTSYDDFEFMQGVIKKFAEFNSAATEVIIFTNQGGFYKKKADLIIKRLTAIMRALPFPIRIFMAVENYWRKPSPAMFDYFMENYVESHNDDIYFVGDAAGRPGDFSATDRMFAMNCGMKFLTPELYFLNRPTEMPLEPFCFRPMQKEVYEKPPVIDPNTVIIIVGSPASGKSTACRKYWPRHVRINQDRLGTRKKCLSLFKHFMKRGYPVVVDNTNPTLVGRADYIKFAKEAGRPVICCYMTASLELARHLGAYRAITQRIPPIPDVAYRFYTSRFETPTLKEGFDEIVCVDFIPANDDVFEYALV